MLRRTFVCLGFLLLAGNLFGPPALVRAQDGASGLAAGHPAEDYARAAALFRAGERNDAVYWFYRGQLRFRVHLNAHADLPADGDPALFASLNEAVGRPINEYAFGDIPALAATLGRVLAWHAGSDDPFTPKARYPGAHGRVRLGLEDLRVRIVAERHAIQAQRRANGLPNRD